jgi:hypothetical protein
MKVNIKVGVVLANTTKLLDRRRVQHFGLHAVQHFGVRAVQRSVSKQELCKIPAGSQL